MFNNELWQKPAGGAGGDFYDYQIANSVRLNGSNQYFNRTASSASTNSDKKAISVWYKRAGRTGNTGATYIMSSQQNRLAALFVNDGSTADNAGYFTDNGGQNGKGKFLQRDFNAWYHLVFLYDSTLSTGVDRVKFYINGVHYTTADTTFWNIDNNGYPNSGAQIGFGMQSNDNNIGRYQYNGSGYFNGYLADFIMIDGGTVPSISDFGETKNGVWIPKDPSGLTFGTNGFWLKFESASNLGNDSSGNNNDWTANNFSTDDQMLDTPTFNSSSNGGNFCIMNSLNSGSNNTFSEGNLKVTNSSGGCTALGTMSLVTGHKWYFEGKCTGSGNNWIGIIEENGYTNSANTNTSIAGSGSFNTYLYAHNGSIYYGANSTATGATFSTGDIIGVLVDLESGTNTIQFYKNGAAQGSAFNLTGTGINYTPMSDRGSGSGDGFWFNFGQEGSFGTGSGGGNSDATGYGSFYYNDGAAAKALCTGNLPVANAVDPAQTDDNYPQELFFISQYTGNLTNRTITTENQPDLLMIRHYSTGQNWYTLDSTRVITDNKYILTNTTDAEATLPQANITSVGATSVGISSGTWLNSSGSDYQMWMWRANGGTTSTNSTGSVSVTQQVDPSGGFSISTYSGAGGTGTIGHGLSSAPTMVWVKQLNGSNSWAVYAKGAGATKYSYINGTNAFGTAAMWQNTTPSSSLVYLGDNNEVNHSGRTYVAYCFADTEGYIKSGSYVGNGSTDNAFVYTGFRPAFVMIKGIAAGSGWNVHDNALSPFNVADTALQLNTNSAELSNYNIDMLSNGFKIRDADGDLGTNGNTYVYLAFAKNPFKYATAR